MGEPKYKDWILETIDQLRKRKARPDLERICHMVERKHGLSSQEIEADLGRLVETEVVIKVDYKGSTSYRNAAKWRKCHLGGQLLNATEASRKIAAAVKALLELDKAQGGDGNGGSTAAEIERWLTEQDPETNLKEKSLQLTLEKEIDAGRLDPAPGERFVIGANPKKTPSKSKSLTSSGGGSSGASGSKSASASGAQVPPSAVHGDGSVSSLTPPTPSSAKAGSPSKKGRPPGSTTKRKKIKKTLGPDFESYPPIKKSRRDSTGSKEDIKPITPILIPQDAPICDYCLLSSACNRNGMPEDLLICKDCRAKAHPSCMDYSEELAKRARTSPWQCIDCKTCYICEDSGDPDAMLFCDACDKGYHMNCHTPPIADKPTGKWVCSKCVKEVGVGDGEMDTGAGPHMHERRPIKQERRGTVGLPTPSDSPVHFPDDQERKESTAKMNGTLPAPIPKLAQTLKMEVPDASEWTIEDVVKFFKDMGFPDQADVFREQEIDGKSLLLMKRSDVLTGLALKLGPALKIYAHVQRLQTRGQLIH